MYYKLLTREWVTRIVKSFRAHAQSLNLAIYQAESPLQSVPEKYSHLTKNQTVVFCSIVLNFLDSKYLFVNLDFETPTIQIQ